MHPIFTSLALASLVLGGCEDPATAPPEAAPKAQAATVESSAASPAPSGIRVIAPGSIEVRPGATEVYGDPADVDFGLVKPGSKLTADVVLVNPFPTPMTIAQAVPTCQCTTVEVAGETIPPGGGIAIPITLQVPSTTGKKQAAVNTVLQGPDGRNVRGPRLTLTAIAAYAVKTTPLYIDALPPKPATGSVAVAATDGRPFRVLTVNGRPPVLLTPDQPLAQHVVQYDLEPAATQAAKVGADVFPKWMIFETDHPEAPVIEMRIRHPFSKLPHQTRNVSIQFDGNIANLGAIPPGGTGTFDVELKQFAGKLVTGVRTTSPNFRADLVEQIEGAGDRVRVRVAVTNVGGAGSVFMIPITFDTTAGSEAMYATGVVR
ncbi:DUF1573 domain-containing protein [bacterium]|nr:DUF1573 domain-containing protein [bacterium]